MGGPRWQSSVDELLTELRDTETAIRRAYSTVLELVAELEARGAASECGYRSVPELLKDVLRISRTEATRRVRHATAVTEVPLTSGGTLPAPLPLSGAALRAGTLAGEHLDVITRTLADLPPHITPHQRAAAEHSLVDAAVRTDPRTLTIFAGQVRAYLDQDGTTPTDAELAEPINELRLTTRRNGRVAFTGELEPEAGALLRTVLSPLAKPRPGSDTGPDPRTPAERHGDALADLLHLAASTGGLPGEAGEKPHLIVTVPLHHLRTTGAAPPPTPADRAAADSAADQAPADATASAGPVAVLDRAGALDAASARRLACDSKITPAVLGAESEILDLGRASYTVNHALRRALVFRDNGCAFPDCDRPHQWQYR